MADWLLLRLPRVPDEPASWLVVDARGTPVGPLESGPLAAAATRTAGRRVWVIVPGTDVLLAEPEVPVKAGLKLQQLVPYALEEQLADNIEDLHFAIGKRASDSTRAPVAVAFRAGGGRAPALRRRQDPAPHRGAPPRFRAAASGGDADQSPAGRLRPGRGGRGGAARLARRGDPAPLAPWSARRRQGGRVAMAEEPRAPGRRLDPRRFSRRHARGTERARCAPPHGAAPRRRARRRR